MWHWLVGVTVWGIGTACPAFAGVQGPPEEATGATVEGKVAGAVGRSFNAERDNLSSKKLLEAVKNRDMQRVSALLEQGVSAEAVEPDGMTALHWAAALDEPEIAAALLKAGARAYAMNRYGVPPLFLACQNGSGVMTELLLQHGADAKGAVRGGETLLMTAARTGRTEPVRLLLKRGADVNARDENDQTAVMWAAAEGHSQVVRMLIDAGADFRTPLKSGFTPLMFAAREGCTDVVRELLKAGADVNEIMKPVRSGRKAPRPGTNPLIMAIENGHFELAVMLLEAGADPNDQRSGFTPLHTMTWVRKPNRGDGDDGDPPPSVSGNLTSLQFLQELVSRGADVNARLLKGASGKGRLKQAGATPFLMAADTADLPMMKLLLKLGADPAITNDDNATALMAAAGLGTLAPGEEAGTEDEVLQAVLLTLELGGDVNHVDKNGETAMHGAAYANMPRVVRLLADHGAEIGVWNRPNKYGWTPLLIAEGFRPGNFKPSVATIDALHQLMIENGLTPPAPTPRETPTAAEKYPPN